jgi:alkanesulfonate monooxygenase SsuD/methylene tetrahydromethanopterin reductase-like flavin-dependent oxidoreductase (luciferase family)
VKFGIIYEICRPEPFDGFLSEPDAFWQAVEQIALAEEMGFDYAWAVEHHFLEGYSLSSAPEVFLSAVAQHTERIRIGHAVRLLPPPFNHPVRSAEMAATLDIMSRGRLEMGVGRSITNEELGGFGVATEDSRPMLNEVLPELVKMWTHEEYPGFEGKYFSMPPRRVIPKPVQKPHPPLWMACTQPASFGLAAEFGIGALCFGVGAPGDILESLKRYKEKILEPTRQVGQFVNNAVAPATILFCGEDQAKAMQMGGAAALWFAAHAQQLFAPWMGKDVKGYEYYSDLAKNRPPGEGMELALEYGCVGTPDMVARGVEAYEDAGFDQLVFMVQAGRIPHTDILASLRLFGKEVLPRFR